MKPIYKSMLCLFGAATMLSSCEDFLTRDSEDSYTMSGYLTSEEALKNYTFQLYGPKTWNEFDDKFSWCVGEIYSGNVYHNYGDEGQFHFMTFSNTNANILNGYTALYGVIARANMIINDVPSICKENGLSEEAINRALGEAMMFRGMAYFFLAEYFGASPIVLHNSDNIVNGKAFDVPRANRKSLYAQIEKDWKKAYDLLPESAWSNRGERVTKYAAAGMLTKLYVTMASCQRKLSDKNNNYVCDNPNDYYNKAIKYGNKVISACGGDMTKKEDYDRMFWPTTDSKEILFGLRFEKGEYGMGSSRQIQFARSKFLAHETNAYGGEKGLTTNLFNSFNLNEGDADVRLKACCYYNPYDYGGSSCTDKQLRSKINNGKADSARYELVDGSIYYYYLNPNKSVAKTTPYGNEPNSAIFNHIRKFVYRTPVTNEFSCPLTIPFLRVADVYLLVAEAKMGLEHKGVSSLSTAGNKEIDVVRQRAGIKPLGSVPVAFYTPDEEGVSKKVTGYATIDGKKEQFDATYPVFDPTYDLMLERRWEFALECQAWLDIKRLYYREEKAAKNYVKEQDRGYIYAEAYGIDGVKESKEGYMRKKAIYELSKQAHAKDSKIPLQEEEKTIKLENIQWFLPVPSAVALSGGSANGAAQDVSGQIKDGSYKY